MAGVNTQTSPDAWGLDVLGVAPNAVIPDALLLQATSKAGFVEGDAPYVRVPRINLDDDVQPVREGADIPEADPDLSELILLTVKVAELIKVSREQLAQPSALDVISHEVKRSMTYKADSMVLNSPTPVSPEVWPPAGLLAKATVAGNITDNLDALIDAFAAIENTPGGQTTHIIANPLAYAELRKFKKATASNESLLGAGTEAGPKTLLSVPVLTTSAMPVNKVLVLDKTQVLSAYGNLMLAKSDQHYFGSDSIAIRATWRFGVGFSNFEAGQVLTVVP